MSRRMSRRRLGPAGYLKHRHRLDTRLMTEGLTPRTSRPADRLTGPTEWIAFLVYRIYYHNFSLIASHARAALNVHKTVPTTGIRKRESEFISAEPCTACVCVGEEIEVGVSEFCEESKDDVDFRTRFPAKTVGPRIFLGFLRTITVNKLYEHVNHHNRNAKAIFSTTILKLLLTHGYYNYETNTLTVCG